MDALRKRNFGSALGLCLVLLWDPRGASSAPATLLFEDDFTGGIPGWTAVQPVGGSYTDGPMLWQYDVPTGSFSEQSNIFTGPAAASATRIAVMLINDTVAPSNFTFTARLTAGDNDAFGLVWGYQSEDVFYRVSFAEQPRTAGWPFEGWAVDRMDNNQFSDLFGGGTTNFVPSFVNTPGFPFVPFDVTIAVTNNLLTLTVVDDPEGAAIVYNLVNGEALRGQTGGKVGLFSWGQSGGTPRSFRIQNPALSPAPLAGDLSRVLANWSFLVTPRSDGTTDLNGPGPALWSQGLGIDGDRGTMIENSDLFLNADNNAAGTAHFAAPSAVAGDVNWSNYVYSARLISSDNDGYGILLRFKDEMNFYRIAFRGQNSTSGVKQGISIQKNVGLVFEEIFASTQFIPPVEVPIDVHASIRGNRLQVIVISDPESAAAQRYFFGPFDITGGTVDNGKIGVFSWAQYGIGGPTGSEEGTEVDFVRVSEVSGEALFVASAFGAPDPPVGLNDLPAGSQVTASVTNIIVDQPGVRRISVGWDGFGSVPAGGTSNQVTFNLDSFSLLTWKWRTEYLLTAGASAGGQVQGVPGDWLPEGTSVALTAMPEAGFIFTGWTGDAAFAISSTLNLTMNRPFNVTARFAPDSDADGLPDDWEQRFFGGLTTAPADDPDQDGRSNLTEYQGGTDPTLAEAVVVSDGLVSRWENVQRDPILPGQLIVRDFGSGFRGVWENANDFREAVDPTIIGSNNIVDNVSFEGPRIVIRTNVWDPAWSNITAQVIFSVGDNDGNCVYFRYQDELNWYRVTVVGENNNAAWRAPFGVSIQKRVGGVFSELGRDETFATDPADISFFKRIRVTVTADGPNFEVRVTGWDVRTVPPDWLTASEAVIMFIDDSLANGRLGVGTWGQGGGGPATPENPVNAGVLIEDVLVRVGDVEVFREDWEQVPLAAELPAGWTNAQAGTLAQGDWRVSAHGSIMQLSNVGPPTSATATVPRGDAEGPILVAPAPGVANYYLEAAMHPFDDDGIGFVYDFVDADNYSRVLFVSQATAAGRVPQGLTISRKRAGGWSDLIAGEPGFVYRPGYPFAIQFSSVNGNYHLTARDLDDPSRMQSWTWTDTATSASSRAGFATWESTDAHFLYLRQHSLEPGPAPAELRITGIAVSGGNVVLTISNPDGAPYAVEQATSLGPANWSTIASNQTGTQWSAPAPAGPGPFFYRLRQGP